MMSQGQGRRESYKGYVLDAEPRKRGGDWIARVVIEIHEGHAVHFQSVSDDPSKKYRTREEAERASLQLGRGIIDSRP